MPARSLLPALPCPRTPSRPFLPAHACPQVLNAKPETAQRESEIIAQAGRKGAVTISTNMAGRGTDILLGGNPSFMAKLWLRQALAAAAGISIPPPADGFYPTEPSAEAKARAQLAIDAFVQSEPLGGECGPEQALLGLDAALAAAASNAPIVEGGIEDFAREAFELLVDEFEAVLGPEKEEVMLAGGLHVIGTNLHDSRRIDDQLRGRAGRQGDPGSTQFFLSLEDRVFRLFGGDKASTAIRSPALRSDPLPCDPIPCPAIRSPALRCPSPALPLPCNPISHIVHR